MEGSEYHDPDYPAVREVPRAVADDAVRLERARALLRREIQAELAVKEREVIAIDQRMWEARHALHRLRRVLLQQHYGASLQPAMQQEPEPARASTQISTILRNKQKRLHPSQRRLTGRTTVTSEELFPFPYGSCDGAVKDVTIPADSEVRSLRSEANAPAADQVKAQEEPEASKPKKIPRHVEPPCNRNVVTLEPSGRSQQKHKYRIIIGNTSKYSPAASRADRSTHAWLLYVRGGGGGGGGGGDVSAFVTSVAVRLHESYAPHHVVRVDKPPFHVSRRGWGEFPASVELHFALPQLNRPLTVEHTLRLDRRRSGLQTLGAETIVDVWLYSNQEMLKHAYKGSEIAEGPPVPDAAPAVPPVTEEQWSDFFSTATTELDVDEMIIKPVKKVKMKMNAIAEENGAMNGVCNDIEIKQEPIEMEIEEELENCLNNEDNGLGEMELDKTIKSEHTDDEKHLLKYVDPCTGKVYYLEVDRRIDVGKVQEIVWNADDNNIEEIHNVPFTTPNGVPEHVHIKTENVDYVEYDKPTGEMENNYPHLENDHCYLQPVHKHQHSSALPVRNVDECESKRLDLGKIVSGMNCVRSAVSFALTKIPIVTKMADNEHFRRMFPFVVRDESTFWQLDEVKRRNIEWSRAKVINRLLTKHFPDKTRVWRTKQILYYARLHGHLVPPPPAAPDELAAWSEHETQWELLKGFRRAFPHPSDVHSGAVFEERRVRSAAAPPAVVELPCDSDDELDVLGDGEAAVREPDAAEATLEVLPMDSEEERLRCYFVERTCAEIGIELRNEDVGSGFSHSAVHRVMLAAVRCLASDVLRSAAAECYTRGDRAPPLWDRNARPAVGLQHVFTALRRDARMSLFTADGLCAAPADYSERL